MEYLAIIYAIKKFHPYLSGCKFEVYTDHIALQSVFKLKDPNGRLFRMKMLHMPYDCTVKFRKGKAHTNVDALSRLISVEHEPNTNCEPFNLNQMAEKTMLLVTKPNYSNTLNAIVQINTETNPESDIYKNNHLMKFVKEGKHIDGATTKQIEKVLKQAEHYSFKISNPNHRQKDSKRYFIGRI